MEDDPNIRYESILWALEYTKGKNIFLLSRPFLEQELRIRFPELEEMSIEKKYPHTLSVSLKTSPVIALWKYTVLPEGTEEKVFEEGFVNAKGTFLPNGGGNIILVIEDVSPRSEPPLFAEDMISPERLEEILWGKGELERITGISIPSVQYLRNAQEVHFMGENGTAFWLVTDTPFKDQLKKLEDSLQEYEIFSKPIDYIDLRISQKIIYAPKN